MGMAGATSAPYQSIPSRPRISAAEVLPAPHQTFSGEQGISMAGVSSGTDTIRIGAYIARQNASREYSVQFTRSWADLGANRLCDRLGALKDMKRKGDKYRFSTPRGRGNIEYGARPSSYVMTYCRFCGQYGHRTSGHFATSCPITHLELRLASAHVPSTFPASGQASEHQTLGDRLCSRCRNLRTPLP
ncbi:unnamed protein product [Arabis nemorensis]|uniref:Uncharacterized protein n=1 Tax=Arabis nemorensis TaxID=586526 RepID=A0A565C960_9BRAS|nr:unnamed protein product [Arabis nemorensis]